MIHSRVSSSTRWHSNQLKHPDDPQGQARILLLLDPITLREALVMDENTHVGITLIIGFYFNDTYRQVLKKS
jgi:hypothetical protein